MSKKEHKHRCSEDAAENMRQEERSEECPGAKQSEGQSKEPAEQEEDLNTRYLRLAADFQNYRRRSEKERNDIYAYANEKIVGELLDVVDNFERAMEHARECEDKQFAEGMELILKQIKGVLEKNRVEEIKALGEVFDPALHNAVMTESTEDAEQSGKVVKVLQKGYTLNSKVIRPAMVAVAQ